MPELDANQIASVDLAASARSEIIRALTAGGFPSDDQHRMVAAWAASAAANSVRAMRSDLRIVDAFQRRYNQPTLPVTPAQFHLLLDELSRAGKAKASISRLVASMKRLHALAGLPSCVDDLILYKLRQIRRTDGRQVKQARGLRLKGETRDLLQDDPKPLSLMALLDAIPPAPTGFRDRALLSSAYDAGLRRSEAVRIRVEHIERLPNGEGSLFIPRSKTDQEGEGARAWLSARSIEYIDEWLSLAQIVEGFVFRSLSYRVSERGHLSEAAVGQILKSRLNAHLGNLEASGQIDPTERKSIVEATSSHSMRVGCDQDLFAAGLDIGAIMQGLRWSSPRQPLAYARHLAPATSKLASLMRQARS